MTDIVLGAGIVGTSLALQLRMRGRDVVLVDRQAPGHGTSYGNAGLLERSDLMPRTFPRSPLELAQYAAGMRTEARVHLGFLPQVAGFLYRYWANSAPARTKGLPHELAPLFLDSVAAHKELMAAADATHLFRPDGWLHLFRKTGVSADMREAVERARDYGMQADIIDAEEIAEREPALQAPIRQAVHWRESASITDPLELTTAYARHFRELGGEIAEIQAESIGQHGAGWRVEGGAERIEGANLVIALGPWSGDVIAPLGYRYPLAVKRGYHMHYAIEDELKPRLPIIDAENGFALNPMRQGMRLTTGIEFAGRDVRPTPLQLERTEPRARELFELGDRVDAQPWMGSRPCTADMKPLIGPAPRHKGLWFSFGHAHHGLTLAAISGKALAETISGETPSVSLAPYSPARF